MEHIARHEANSLRTRWPLISLAMTIERLYRLRHLHRGSQRFCRDFLNPYVNLHRPRFFAESITDAKGKTGKRYRLRDMMTPYEKLKSLPHRGRLPQVRPDVRLSRQASRGDQR